MEEYAVAMSLTVFSKPWLISGVAALAATGVGAQVWRDSHRAPLLQVSFWGLSAGQAIFIRTPDDYRILINGGPNSEVIRRLTEMLPFYSRHIDMLIATDLEDKNISGLIDVADRYSVGEVYVPAVTAQSLGLASSTGAAETFFETLAARGIPVRSAAAGDIFPLGDRISAEALFPLAATDSEAFAYSRASAPELALRITYGSSSFILAGAASVKIQKQIAGALAGLGRGPADVLSISRSAADMAEDLMKTVRPAFLVHAQSPQKISSRSQSSLKKKPPPASLLGISKDHLINLKKTPEAVFVSDGSTVKHITE